MIGENYVTIQGWMAEEMGLKGNELIAYAFVYGFTQDGRPKRISYSYLARWLQATRQTAINTITSLERKNLIEKTQKGSPGGIENYYLAKKGPGQKNKPGLIKNLYQGGGKEKEPGKTNNDLDVTDYEKTEGSNEPGKIDLSIEEIIKTGKEFFSRRG
jgi:ADP-ribose pyrophosphatase YjhB (NUDIX family)